MARPGASSASRRAVDALGHVVEGDRSDLHHHLGAHLARSGDGARFSVWAPAAQRISVVGEWNGWDEAADPLERVGDEVWTAWCGRARHGHRYQLAVTGADGATVRRADPMAFHAEVPPGTASIVHGTRHRWGDDAWMAARPAHVADVPMSIYEVHLGSWRRGPDGELGYRSIAAPLIDHVTRHGFTHVELLPVMGHPFGGSWGYQVTSYFAPASRWGTPDDLRALVDALHQAGIGVILDWVPAHFPTDGWALARFDGTACYEHPDPRRGHHPDWDTAIFDFGKPGVRSFLLSSARFWLEELHADGLRVDAVASMLYLDYSRGDGEWEPNEHGGREHLEAVSLLQAVNVMAHDPEVGGFTVAEESTAWPGVTRPVEHGGLGFSLKWDLGWMHDALGYFGRDPVHRRHHHDELTFGAHYAPSEHFVLPLSHDEVVHGKGSLLVRMPGDEWQRRANLRALYAWMWAHPGKQLLFMGAELAQEREWDHDGELAWAEAADDPGRAGIGRLVADLNARYRERPALWSQDGRDDGFRWIVNDPDANLAAFVRWGAGGEALVCVANLGPVVREQALGLPMAGPWREVLDTDHLAYGGSGVGNGGSVDAAAVPLQGQPASATLLLPPLAVTWLEPA